MVILESIAVYAIVKNRRKIRDRFGEVRSNVSDRVDMVRGRVRYRVFGR